MQFMNEYEPINETEEGIEISLKLSQSAKTELPIVVTEDGTTNFFIPVFSKALSSILVTASGIEISIKLWQLRNDVFGIVLIEDGSVIFDNVSQPLNTKSPSVVTESGIVISFNSLHSENELGPIIFNSIGNVTFVSAVQPKNALFEMVVTESGSEMVSSEVHSLKQFSSMVVIDDGSSNKICVNDEHLSKQNLPICETEDGITTWESDIHWKKE